ncbi:MAG: hypothetical protein M3460_06485 [Actinomycetota bacterium]|nr:hypothetical protein [Actinomycetota bacterium]
MSDAGGTPSDCGPACSGLNPADLGLSQAQPLAEQGLRDAAGTVDRVVVEVDAVGAGNAADVLGGKGVLELLGLPELSSGT